MEKQLHKEMLTILTKLEGIHASIEHHLIMLNNVYTKIKESNKEIDEKGIRPRMGKYFDKKGQMKKNSTISIAVLNQA